MQHRTLARAAGVAAEVDRGSQPAVGGNKIGNPPASTAAIWKGEESPGYSKSMVQP
ncbi:hypothetical protein ACFQ9Q_28715 [Streptomyces virginiae]|uniref:hypothetical protein n=1 Tax=Streptomyces virginiae TaxID=1961 RepID=UPI003694B397